MRFKWIRNACVFSFQITHQLRLVFLWVLAFSISYPLAAQDCSPLPNNWYATDLGERDTDNGETDEASSVCYKEGSDTYELEAYGFDLWTDNDRVFYIYTLCSGNVDIVAKIEDFTIPAGEFAKVGVMIRENLNKDGKMAIAMFTDSRRFLIQGRKEDGQFMTDECCSNAENDDVDFMPEFPKWVRLQRLGNLFNGYYSLDGVNWIFHNSVTVDMADDVLVGIGANSFDFQNPSTSTFTNVSISGGACIQNGQPDIQTTLSVDNTNIPLNGSINVQGVVSNTGDAPAVDPNEDFFANHFLSLDTAFSEEEDYFVGGLFFGKRTLLPGVSEVNNETLEMNKDPKGSVPEGCYYLLYVGDSKFVIDESNENNNITIHDQLINVGNPNPDLIVESVTPTPTEIEANDLVDVTFSIKNEGTCEAPATTACLYLSSDLSLSSADVLLVEDIDIPALAIDQNSLQNTQVTIPNNTIAGTYYIIARADCEDNANEKDEDNNTLASGPITVLEPIPLTPDLSVSDISVDPLAVIKGDPLAVSFTIHNTGTANASQSTACLYLSADNQFDLTDLKLADVPIASIDLNASLIIEESVNIPLATEAGTYFIIIIADCEEGISESNETNNTSFSLAFSIIDEPLADLEVTTATVQPTSVKVGGEIILSLTVTNQGNANANASRLCYYLSLDENLNPATDTLLGEQVVESLTTSSSASFQINENIPASTIPGTYFILLDADCDEEIPESNEDNIVATNSLSIEAIPLPPIPDLVISSASASPVTLQAEEELTVNVLIENLGTGDAAPSQICFYLSTDDVYNEGVDELLSSEAVSALISGEEENITSTIILSANLLPGPYFIIAIADCQETIEEGNEINIRATNAFEIIEEPPMFPDLTVNSVNASPLSLAPGDNIELSYTIQNLGELASESTDICYYFSSDNTLNINSDVLLLTSSINALGAGVSLPGNQTLALPTNIPDGDYFIIPFVDCQAAVNEENENNNVSSSNGFSIENIPNPVADPADLIVNEILYNADSIVVGGGIQAEYNISNAGDTASSAFSVCFYLSTDQLFQESIDIFLSKNEVTTIAAGEDITQTTSISIPENILAGNYFLIMVLDCDEEVDEGNGENNNEGTSNASFNVRENRDICANINNIITPNGDNINDQWIVPNAAFSNSVSVIIVDRWGNMIFEANNYGSSSNWWEGRIDGSARIAPQGTYYYIIQTEGSECRGTITVLRN